MSGTSVCDFPGCGTDGTIVSRLSPEGFLVATERRLTHFEKPTGDFTIAVLATTNSWAEYGPESVKPRTKATVMLHQLQSSLAVES